MGMKNNSGHFPGRKSASSPQINALKFGLDIQFFAVNQPDQRMSPRGKALYESADSVLLKNQIVELYRPGALIGDGGTADALRHEVATGECVGGKSHLLKAKQRVISLQRLLASGKLQGKDIQIAKNLISDLEDALKGI